MRNLIAFFRRFQIFLVFALLQIVALWTYVSYSEFAKLQALTTTGEINGRIMAVRNDVTKHFGLENENRKLTLENKWLRERLKESNYQLERGRISIDDTVYLQQYTFIPATVISSTFDKRNNYMTIDLGSVHGIKEEMGVVTSDGIVGRVHTVGKHFSLVKTILSNNINIDVMLEKQGAFGLLKWDQSSARTVQVTGISNDLFVKKWTKVVTRGESGIFPRGFTVGYIAKLKPIEGKPLWDIHVRTAVDFRRIQKVYVVKDLLLEEIQAIERAIPVDKEETNLN
jgi:rod shape-determining protein MreC